MKKCTQLKQMINSNSLEFIMEAHNGLSAKIVEEAGFKGIWGSGLSISAALGVRDNNEASWTQVLEVCEFMSDATRIPILLDGDTGFGNFNSFRRLVTKLEQRGIAGVCIEDKIFPKTNSFIDGSKQPLTEIDEFCGKIKSGKDAQKDDDFVIVARVEALIAGWGLEIALKRANAYADAGADAILVHSKISSSKEIEMFMERWENKKPIVIVPTMYYQTPIQVFVDSGVSLVIWANHTLRASITNMKKVVKNIYQDKTLKKIEDQIVPVKEIFRLQNIQEYKDAEELYLPKKKTYKGLILAASKGANFGSLTDDKPKAMIRIGNETILSRIVKVFNERNIKDVNVVTGYKKEAVDIPNLNYIENEFYDQKGLLFSLYTARKVFTGDTVVSFGDILFEEEILRKLTICTEDIVLAVDVKIPEDYAVSKDMVKGERVFSEAFGTKNTCLVKEITAVNNNENIEGYSGEFIGLMKMSKKGALIFQSEMEKFLELDPDFFKHATLNDYLNYLIKKGIKVHLKYFSGQWKDIDSIEDLTYLIDLYSGRKTGEG